MEIDTANKFFVGVRGDEITVMRPPHLMSKKDALVFAAHLVSLADDRGEFAAILEAVQNG